MLIPRVWGREGRKISRVATRLSISPKKVRRILHSAGLVRNPFDTARHRWSIDQPQEGARRAIASRENVPSQTEAAGRKM